MKVKKISEVAETIQLEEDDDFELFAESIGTILYKDQEDNLYCVYHYYDQNRVVFYSQKTKAWRPLLEEKIDIDNLEEIDFELALEIYKIKPPFESLKEIEKMEADKRLNQILKLREETPHKVIGWVASITNRSYCEDDDNYYLAAIVNDIVEHGYFFTGDSIELFPIFEDGTYASYSARGWGNIIALSKNKASDYDYSLYAWNPSGKYDDYVLPKHGFYEHISISINVDKEQFDYIEKYVANFYELEDEIIKDYYGIRYFLDIELNEISPSDYERIGKVKLVNNNRELYFDIIPPFFINNKEELNSEIDYYSDEFGFKIMVAGDFEKIIEKLKYSPVLIAILRD